MFPFYVCFPPSRLEVKIDTYLYISKKILKNMKKDGKKKNDDHFLFLYNLIFIPTYYVVTAFP